MSSEKRDFTDFEAFPGSTIENVHTMDKLYMVDSFERVRSWAMFIRVVKDNNRQTGIDWDLRAETQMPIYTKYYQGEDIPKGCAVQAYVENGITDGKITRASPTYFTEYTNVGKSNQRSPFQQALIYARSQWLKRKEKGGSETLTSKVKKNAMYFPMLARTFEKGEKHLKFPIYVQPKLDGIRCVTYLKKYPGTVDDVVMYTRTRKEFPSVEYLKVILYKYLVDLYDVEKKQSIYLDGELYKHGKRLQDISGEARNETKKTNDNELHIYDCFYPKELDMTFEDRHKQLLNLYDGISTKDAKYIKQVPCYLVADLTEATKKYNTFKKLKYEGAMLRNADGPYLSSPEKTGEFLRSPDLVKLKPKFTDEFTIVGYSQGTRGKDRGAIIWQCETSDHVTFNVTPKDMTYVERYDMFKKVDASFAKYKGLPLTVEYEDLSNLQVPLRAKALTIRNYE